MKFPALLLTPTLTLFAFQALAQEAPAAPVTAPDAAAIPAPATTPAPLPAPAPAAPTYPVPTLAPAAPAVTTELVVVPPAPMPTGGVGKDGNPLAGWHNDLFYLRDVDDNFRLYVQGRAQIDFYSYAGPGVSDTTLKPTLFLRRIRPEITGEFFHSWWFSIAGDFGATALDNPTGGATETSAAGPGVTPTGTTGKYAGAQTAHLQAAPTDVFLNYRADPLFNVQVGQFDAPFTMENRTSDKYIPFMERSLAVRDVGISTNKEIGGMIWGETSDKYWFYSAGLFDGNGQNKLNTDSNGDIMARTFVHPLATDTTELKDLQIGASFRYGQRDKKFTNYDYNSFSTQGNYAFWKPTYTGSEGTTHILPSGAQFGLAGELRMPISFVDLTSEVVYIHNDTREVQEGYQSVPGALSLRRGDMHGVSYYVQAGIWLGKRDVTGLPGYENMPHVDFKKADPVDQPHAVQLLAKWEQVHLNYTGASRAGLTDIKNADGEIKANAFSLGVNYWVSRHIRLTANYVLNMFPDSAPSTATTTGSPVWSSSNRAQAPGNTLPTKDAARSDDDARNNAHVLHEFLARIAVAL